MPERMPLPPPGDTFVFVATEMALDHKVVKGVPYSAQGVTEMTQTLGDGNRIVRRNTVSVYRDSEGRTRRDQTIGGIGPFAAAGDPPQTFFINDPVAGVHFILDPRSRTARKLTLRRIDDNTDLAAPHPPPPGVRLGRKREKIGAGADMMAFDYELAPPPGGDMHGGTAFFFSREDGEPKKESLGKQVFEGVEAEGTRTTFTIPAGKIGNELPINIVSERWYSNELQTVVMTRHSDPRHGETVYRLTNINRGEPARTLFEVPADYKLKEGHGNTFQFRTHAPDKQKEKVKQN